MNVDMSRGATLSDRPPADSSGNGNIQTFAGVALGPGTLYGALARLEARGFIRPVGGADRRQPYRLTAAGRRHVEGELAALESVLRMGRRRLRRRSA